MLTFIQSCFAFSFVPKQWKEAILFVFFKGKGDPRKPTSYRAISLTSILAKIYEKILLNRLTTWFLSTRLSKLPQFGFRKSCSTLHAVFQLRTLIMHLMSTTKAPVFVAFVDLQRAFPSVCRDSLFQRLLNMGAPKMLVAAIRAFYVANAAKLRVEDSLSVSFFVSLGVLEGSILSPALFGILFSAIWEFIATEAFPSIRRHVIRREGYFFALFDIYLMSFLKDLLNIFSLLSFDNRLGIWFIAFADDLCVVALSPKCLEVALNTLRERMLEANLVMRCL